jgi:hypothetical protein
MEVYDARGQLRERRTSSREVGGIYPLPISTKADDPTGNWRVKVKAGGASFERLLKIETVKPNRLKIDLDFGGETLTSDNDPLNAVLQSDWLTGSPASGLRAVVEVQLRSSTTQFSKYPTFEFDDPTRRLENTEARVLFDGNLDDSGKATVRGNLLNNQEAPGMLSASFRTRVFERGGDFSTDNQTIAYSPFKAYAGIEIPINKYGEPRIEVGKTGAIRLVSVDAQGRPQAGRKLSASLYSVDWRWWWDQGDDNVAQYNTNNRIGPLLAKMAPYPFSISRDRVTDETAPVKFLRPQHPVLNQPNIITEKDFDSWVQERGIYFATDADPNFTSILSVNDPNDKPSEGSLIVAPYGKGNFVYTGLAFFRQLPAGVPGAYRLFVNLLSIPQNK